jgi:hypothetical protein
MRNRWPRIASAAVASSSVMVASMWMHGSAQPTGEVTVTVSAEAVGISITGGAVNFGGPYAPNELLRAHPQESIRHALPPTVTNTGNTTIGYLDVTFDGPAGAEASCDSGAGSWSAHASSSAQDRFVLRAWANSSTNITQFNSNARAVAPSTGSGNVLTGDTTIEASDSLPLLMELRMPNPPVAGGSGCSISLTVTAAAE